MQTLTVIVDRDTMLNLIHLESFVCLQESGSFTAAADRLGIGQSTVTQHIQRLEKSLGKQLIDRTTHRVQLTTEGEALLSYARAMLDLNGKVYSLFGENRLRGRLRLGVSEDVVASRLTLILEDFIRLHPLVDLELTVALSSPLYQMLDVGELDLVLAKRHIGEAQGRLLYREPLVWLARDPELLRLKEGEPVPLIAFPTPSITRKIAQDTLDRHKILWRIVCTCASLSGLTAAARAGMGVLVQPRSMAPDGLKEVSGGWLPLLDDVEFVLVPRRGADAALVEALSALIIARLVPQAD